MTTKRTDRQHDQDFLATLEEGVKAVLADKKAKASERVAAITAGAKLLAIKHKLSDDAEKNFFNS